MNATAQAVSQLLQGVSTKQSAHRLRVSRLLVPIACILLGLNESTRDLTLQVLSDAYWQVAAFVAATLWLFYTIERQLNGLNNLSSKMLKSRSLQILFAATMGLFPGCGGAIIVMTQFIRGRLGFGALVAVLTATMGDAAFVLLASSPSAAAIVLPVCFVSGVAMGLIVERLHPRDFMRPTTGTNTAKVLTDAIYQSGTSLVTAGVNPTDLKRGIDAAAETQGEERGSRITTESTSSIHLGGLIWKVLLIPTGLIALLIAFQVSPEAVVGLPTGMIAPVGSGIAFVLLCSWAVSSSNGQLGCDGCASPRKSDVFRRVADDTNFVLGWVVAGFLAFEVVMLMVQLDLTSIPTLPSGVVILAAVMVGCIPGCGPQILTTSLFLNGAIPMSAQLGNAISNDGDALFPALALAPRAAMMATLYSTLPALVAAYSYAFFFE